MLGILYNELMMLNIFDGFSMAYSNYGRKKKEKIK